MEEEDCYQKLIDVEELHRVVALRELKDQADTVMQVMDNQDAQSVIFESAMAQLQHPEDVRDIIGQGGKPGSQSLMDLICKEVLPSPSQRGTARPSDAGPRSITPVRGSSSSQQQQEERWMEDVFFLAAHFLYIHRNLHPHFI